MLLLKLFIGLLIVLWGADLLINSSIALGKKYKISEILIGIVVVGFGTSLSELLVSIDAVLKNAAELSLGNIIGSNIANILLVLGFTGLIKNIKVPKVSNFDNFFHFFVIILFFLIFISTKFNLIYGLLFIIIFILYLYRIFKNLKNEDSEISENDQGFVSQKINSHPILFGIPIIIISIFLTVFGAEITVISAIEISKVLGISESVVGLSLIAFGTSLPEIAAGATAIRRMKPKLIFGNIIGSNLYNILLILGFSSLFKTFNYDKKTLLYDVLILMILTIIFTLITRYKINIDKKVSITLIIIYIFYMFFIYFKTFLM